MPVEPRLTYRENVFRALKRYQLVVDVVVGVLFTVFGLTTNTQDLSAGGGILLWVLVCVAFGTALAIRRLAPGLSLAVAWFAALVQMGTGREVATVDVAVFGVLYVTAAYGSRLVFWLGFASAVVGAVVATSYIYFVRGAGGLSLDTLGTAGAVLVAATFALLLAWTVGALVRTGLRARTNRLAQERAEAEASAEQVRVRIARDMHDVVAHSLAVVIAQADGARYAAAADPDAAASALGTISTTARAALADVRVLLTQLRHTQTEGPQPTVGDLEALYAQVRAAGVDLRVDVDPMPATDPPAAVQLAVYRILQEALTNALRHGAQGGTVDVRMSGRVDAVELSVRNPVVGDPAPSGGHGVIGMRERAQLAGGELTASAEDGAFTVRAVIPIRTLDARMTP
jgi:signal transduction histidine kinase